MLQLFENNNNKIIKRSRGHSNKLAWTFNEGDFHSDYELGKQLGAGTFATVKQAIHATSKRKYAVKIVEVARLKNKEKLHEEISILQQLQHPNIIRLYDVYRDEDDAQNYYLVTEQMKGGELFDRIVQKTCYSEHDARGICKGIFRAIHYCHTHSIAHRDLKPENLLLARADNDTHVKLADFGLAKKCLKPKSLYTMCGTQQYMAPEILKRKGHDIQVDMWSLGVIVYILLGGYAPFQGDDEEDTKERIKNGQFRFHKRWWKHVSDDAKDLVTGLLTVRRNKRLTADQVLEHPWIAAEGKSQELSCRNLNLEKLRLFNGKRKLRAAAYAALAASGLVRASFQACRAELDSSSEEDTQKESSFMGLEKRCSSIVAAKSA